MKNRREETFVESYGVGPILLSVAGLVAVIVGVQQGVLHVAPGYQGTINASAEAFDRRKWLLAGVGIAGVAGAVASLRRKRLSVVPVAAGAVVVFEAVRTIVLAATGLPYPLFTETTYRRSGDPVMFVLGAEPFLLVAGGCLFVAAGVAGLRRRRGRETGDELSSPPSTSL
ncbi:hypothetical protein [Salinirubrum litoreum]|uniref:Uncharacterized protein n=1 Tax=Salinirubrum litoreum TaxID=1126234 RepID=A0ABD5RAR7_9EURY|nr:hypothetical protein [Salinirubrum litoreum]